ncbi:MAG: hypothetical protein KatS3mg070_0018 [Meiothermus sp.]|uniref:DISARM anti-phage system protein DrmE domain-containing protein n=1 Tax=Meiothermus sp. TaxID=1955249 RepID=UPI0021DCD7A3|nr:hypothetical protein [Meiothermus sp.]GIW26655.1 MAG: hypothetical protein KatS3mg070_0018 [Meiothermus sp.]
MWGIDRNSLIDDALLRRIYPQGLDVYARLSGVLGRRAWEQRRRLILMDSTRPSPLPQTLAVGLLVADFFHREMYHSPYLKGNLLIVTRQVGQLRESLREFRLGEAGDSLERFWEIRTLSRYQPPGSRPAIYLANPGWPLEHPFAAVIIDATDPRVLACLENLPFNHYLAVTPPLDEATLARLGRSAVLWDEAAKGWVAREFNRHEHPGHPASSPSYRWVEVIEDAELDKVLWAAYQQLAEAQAMFGGFFPLRQAWGLFHQLRMLSVPLYRLENLRKHKGRPTLRDRLDSLEPEAPSHPVQRLLWQRVLDRLSEAYEALQHRDLPPKFFALVEWLEQHNAELRSCWVVATTQTEAILLQSLCMDVSPRQLFIGFGGSAEVLWSNEEERRAAQGLGSERLLLGYRSASQRYLDLGPANVAVLAYPFEARIESYLCEQRQRWLEYLVTERDRVLHSLGLKPPSPPDLPVTRLEFSKQKAVVQPLSVLTEEAPRLDLHALAEYQVNPRTGGNRGPTVEEMKVELEGGLILYLPKTRLVTLFVPGQGNVEKLAQQLQPGDRMIIFVDGVYDDLFERISEALQPLVQMEERLYLELWEAAKLKLQVQYPNMAELHRALARRGLERDPTTVRSWFAKGQTLAPQQFHDFLLLTSIMGLPESLNRPQLWRAIENHRTRHRQLGRLLHRVLESIVSGSGYEGSLREARQQGISLEELLSAVDVRRVVRRS